MKKTLIGIVLIILLGTIFGLIDTNRFSKGEEPIFVVSSYYTDGGTAFHYGLGYQLIDWHILGFDEETKKSFYHANKEVNIFPFWRYGYNSEEVDKSDFEIVNE